MSGHGGRRSQAEWDAITVEIGYALLSAAVAAVSVLGAVAGPAWLLDLPHVIETVLVRTGLILMPVLFLVRVVSVLLRLRRAGQPSRSGRASPDS